MHHFTLKRGGDAGEEEGPSPEWLRASQEPTRSSPAAAEDYDPFLRPSRSGDRKESGASESSQETGDETGSGNEG